MWAKQHILADQFSGQQKVPERISWPGLGSPVSLERQLLVVVRWCVAQAGAHTLPYGSLVLVVVVPLQISPPPLSCQGDKLTGLTSAPWQHKLFSVSFAAVESCIPINVCTTTPARAFPPFHPQRSLHWEGGGPFSKDAAAAPPPAAARWTAPSGGCLGWLEANFEKLWGLLAKKTPPMCFTILRLLWFL